MESVDGLTRAPTTISALRTDKQTSDVQGPSLTNNCDSSYPVRHVQELRHIPFFLLSNRYAVAISTPTDAINAPKRYSYSRDVEVQQPGKVVL